MTKTRRSSQRRSSAAKSALSTPPPPARGNNSGGAVVGDVWDFDAPNFYDFGNAKTPGPTADKWFDVAHPTPAVVRRSRASRMGSDSFLSGEDDDDDDRKSLVPSRPSLSPSRIVVSSDGRLTIDGESSAGRPAAQSVEFSDSDDEVAFNNWKSAQGLAGTTTTTATPLADKRQRAPEAETASARDSAASSKDAGRSARASAVAADPAGRKSDEPRAASDGRLGRPLRASSGKAGGRVAKKTAVRGVPGAAKPLTVPVAGGLGFMRPTKGAAQRSLAKQRDKTTRQLIAEAISRPGAQARLQAARSKLTVPVPFQFRGKELSSSADKQEDEPEPAGATTTTANGAAAKLSKKAQEGLVSKLAGKRRAVPSSGSSTATTTTTTTTTTTGQNDAPTRKLRPTVPRTPQFSKTKRARRATAEVEAGADDGARAARAQLVGSKARSPLRVRVSPLKPTVPRPFVFLSDAAAERSLQRLRSEMARLREEEAALRRFQANPMPEFPTPKKPARQASALHASPFRLVTDQRGEAYQRQLRARLEELEERRRLRMEFRARPIPESLDHPFVPQPSAMPLTTVEEILLRTELRSEERHAYDEDRSERERIREEVLARKRLEEERREEEEIRQLRLALVHRAQPVRHFKPVEIKPSDRALTVPRTPKWHVRTRPTVTAD